MSETISNGYPQVTSGTDGLPGGEEELPFYFIFFCMVLIPYGINVYFIL